MGWSIIPAGSTAPSCGAAAWSHQVVTKRALNSCATSITMFHLDELIGRSLMVMFFIVSGVWTTERLIGCGIISFEKLHIYFHVISLPDR
jgi:hypothetical protein